MQNKMTKKQRVIRHILDGKSAEWVRRHEDISIRKIRQWFKEYGRGGKEARALERPRSTNRVQPLSVDQLKWVYYILTSKSPRDLGLKKSLWTGHFLVQVIKNWIKKDYEPVRIYELVKDFGIHFYNPLPKIQDQWVKDICRMAKTFGDQIIFLDSYALKDSIELIPVHGTKAAIIRTVERATDKVVIFSFNQSKRANRFIVHQGAVTVGVAKDFLENLVHDHPFPTIIFVPSGSIFSHDEVVEFASTLFVKIRINVLPQILDQ
jgi:transposase